MTDVTEVASEIRHLISMGATERQLITLVARHHPDLDAFRCELRTRFVTSIG